MDASFFEIGLKDMPLITFPFGLPMWDKTIIFASFFRVDDMSSVAGLKYFDFWV